MTPDPEAKGTLKGQGLLTALRSGRRERARKGKAALPFQSRVPVLRG